MMPVFLILHALLVISLSRLQNAENVTASQNVEPLKTL